MWMACMVYCRYDSQMEKCRRYLRRRICNTLVRDKDKNIMYLEFQPVRSYGEFLTQTKLEKTILMETALFENFIGQLEFKRHAALQPTEEVEEIAPTARFY